MWMFFCAHYHFYDENDMKISLIKSHLSFTDSDENDANIDVPAVDWPGESRLYLNFTNRLTNVNLHP